MNIQVITISDEVIGNRMDQVISVQKKYFQQEQCKFTVIRTLKEPNLNVNIHKTIYLEEASRDKTIDILVWMDVDILPMRPGFKATIEEMFSRPIETLFACSPWGISAGFFAVRNSDRGIQFLKDWNALARVSKMEPPVWDEAPLIQLVMGRQDYMQAMLCDGHRIVGLSMTNESPLMCHVGGMPLDMKRSVLSQRIEHMNSGTPRSYSQYGEDTLILEWFNGRKGRLLDIGASNGIKDSNSRLLLEMGWTGVLIEANPDLFVQLSRNTEGLHAHCMCSAVGAEPQVRTLHQNMDGLSTTHPEVLRDLMSAGVSYYKTCLVSTLSLREICKVVGRDFDFVSVDAEGMDYDILESGLQHLRGVSLICVETSMPGNPNPEKDQAKWEGLLGQHGFVVWRKTHGNLIFQKIK